MSNEEYFVETYNHYKKNWEVEPLIYLWEKGPIDKLPSNFRVLAFKPTEKRSYWIYATCGMSEIEYNNLIELHLFSLTMDSEIVELLTVIAYYHCNTKKIGLHDTLNFGRSWQKASICKYGLISLPYIHGPDLENLFLSKIHRIAKFYWVIPVTKQEVDYKIDHGIDAIEKVFEETGIDYINPLRDSVV